jgi:hypothetical protein
MPTMLQRLEYNDRLELNLVCDHPLLAVALAHELEVAAYYQWERIEVCFDAAVPPAEGESSGWDPPTEIPGAVRLAHALAELEARGTTIVGKVFGALNPRLSVLAVIVSTELEVSLDAELKLPADGEGAEESAPIGRSALNRHASGIDPATLQEFRALALLEHGIATRLGTAEWSAVHRLATAPERKQEGMS